MVKNTNNRILPENLIQVSSLKNSEDSVPQGHGTDLSYLLGFGVVGVVEAVNAGWKKR